MNYGNTNEYNSISKWFDALVCKYNVILVASAGNSQTWWATGWPYTITPANSYNSLAVGAYSTFGTPDTDRMKNYRYNPYSTNKEYINFKPDVVVAAKDTSGAAPALSGIIAMMIELNPNIKSRPDLIKAIVMASCHRKVLPATDEDVAETMFDGLSLKQGAGAVDAYRALCITLLGSYGTATMFGNMVSIPSIPEIDKNVNFSLSWLKNNIFDDSEVAPDNTIVGEHCVWN